MASPTQFNSDVYVNGSLGCKTFSPPASSITNAAVVALAGIAASKLEHQYQRLFTQVHGSSATAERRVIHTVVGATGDIVSMRSGNVVAATGDSTVTIDLKKNGTTVLTATTQLDSGNAAYSWESAAGFTSTSLTQDDVLEIVQTVSAGTGTLPQGVYVELVIREDAQ